MRYAPPTSSESDELRTASFGYHGSLQYSNVWPRLSTEYAGFVERKQDIGCGNNLCDVYLLRITFLFQGANTMPKVTIDGRLLEFESGQSILEVAHTSQLEIPHDCWHPDLSVAAQCQMCLVHVEGESNPVTACETKCREGMQISLNTPTISSARADRIEQLLAQHPAACPVCDKAGECKLQDHYMAYGRPSPTKKPTMVTEQKGENGPTLTSPVALGPQIMLHADRCTGCSLCVRFMEEVAQSPQLMTVEDGPRSWVKTREGQVLDHPYSLNIVELCPVGALSAQNDQLRVKSWLMQSTPSVCAGCGRGCSIEVDSYQEEVQRYRGRSNPQVNRGWLCDDGRLSYKYLQDPKLRIDQPHIRLEDGSFIPISWAAAEDELIDRLGIYTLDFCPHGYTAEEHSSNKLAISVSSQRTNEELAAFLEFSEKRLRVEQYTLHENASGTSDSFLRVSDLTPNRVGLELVFESYGIYDAGQAELKSGLERGDIQTLFVFGVDEAKADSGWLEVLEQTELVVWASQWTEMTRRADLVLPLASHLELDGTFINTEGVLQRVNQVVHPRGGRKTGLNGVKWMQKALSDQEETEEIRWATMFDRLAKKCPTLRSINPLNLNSLGEKVDSF